MREYVKFQPVNHMIPFLEKQRGEEVKMSLECNVSDPHALSYLPQSSHLP